MCKGTSVYMLILLPYLDRFYLKNKLKKHYLNINIYCNKSWLFNIHIFKIVLWITKISKALVKYFISITKLKKLFIE